VRAHGEMRIGAPDAENGAPNGRSTANRLQVLLLRIDVGRFPRRDIPDVDRVQGYFQAVFLVKEAGDANVPWAAFEDLSTMKEPFGAASDALCRAHRAKCGHRVT